MASLPEEPHKASSTPGRKAWEPTVEEIKEVASLDDEALPVRRFEFGAD